jgi:hypothetical protein
MERDRQAVLNLAQMRCGGKVLHLIWNNQRATKRGLRHMQKIRKH